MKPIIKVCMHHGLLKQEHIRVRKDKKTVCKLCVCESAKKYADANREKVNDKVRKYYQNNKERIAKRRYHKNKSSDIVKKNNRRKVENLTDSYIKTILINHGSNLKRQDIPAHLVQAKRITIQLQRKLKEINES